MRNTKAFIAVFAFLFCASPATSEQFESSTAQIAAWNLGGFFGVPETRLRVQAEGLAMLDAEVVALVEVNPDSIMNRLKTILSDEFGLCYDFKMLPQDAELNIAVMFKCGITAENPRFIANSDLGEGLRKALAVDMKVGQFDFTLIAVHLKSGRDAPEQATRDRQAKVIGDFIADFRASNTREDVLLMGDFNMIPGQDVSNFHHLGADDTMDFLSSWDLQDRFSHILEAGRANLLDGFAVTRTFSTEYIRGSLRVFPMHWAMDIGLERFRDTVSDHLPFVASFRITRDAD